MGGNRTMTEKQFKIFDAMAEPRSENAIRKAEERKEKRQQLKMKQINTIKSLCVDEAYLFQWYQGSVDANPPVWTDEHIKELFKDFYLIPKDSIVPKFEIGDKVLINCRETKSEMTKMLFDKKEGKVLGIWDIKDNPWGNILVGVDVYHNVFHEDELTKIENSNEGDITNDV